MKRSRPKTIAWLLLTSSLFIAACEQPSRAVGADPASEAVLKELHNLEELRARFNQDKGEPRLILLLSPT